MAVSSREFLKRALSTGAVESYTLASFLSGNHRQLANRDGEAIARALVKANLLTPFQARVIYQNERPRLILGNYLLVEEIGRGGMGVVFKAVHRQMLRNVAIKLLNPTIAKSQKAAQRFLREVQTAARLNHRNIVQAYDADVIGKNCYLVMEYVEGDDLASIVRAQGRLEVERAVDFVTQAAIGFGYAHSQGVIHRDIKPHNLLVNEHGVVKVLDMGLAKVLSPSESDAGLTDTGIIMGSVDFMAPELANGTQWASKRSDIYSLGITLWYLLVGSVPYHGDSAISKLLAHREQPIPDLQQECTKASPELCDVFCKMVAKDPEQRFSCMEEVASVLSGTRSAKGSEPSVAPPKASSITDFLSSLQQDHSLGSPPDVSFDQRQIDPLEESTVRFLESLAETDSDVPQASNPNFSRIELPQEEI